MLGPLEVREGGRTFALGGVRQRSVLAILLLRRGEVVSAETLVGLLWGEDAPEDRAGALHQHVSRLRRALEPHEVVLTRAPGYVIEREAGDLDLDRFDALSDEGRERLAAGDAAAAADRMRRALALWRGRPLGDLEHEQFAAEAVARLDEAWIEAVEVRIEADLATGRHAELVAELRTLVRRHPLRERLCGQLMLALYRSGRQGEALEVYADARRQLAESLGLEPGPALQRLQQAVLAQDPFLELPSESEPFPGSAEAPPGANPPGSAPGTIRRSRRGLVAALLAVLLAAVVASALQRDGDGAGTDTLVAAGGGGLVAVDVATGRVERRLAVGRTPASLGMAGDLLWVVDADARTLLAVDEASGAVEALATGGTPTEVAVAEERVWVGNGRPLGSAQHVGPRATEVVRLDPDTRTVRATVRLRSPRGTVSNAVDNRLAAADGAVWSVTPSGGVVRIDAATDAITASRPRARAIAVAAGGAGVWALRGDGRMLRLDPRTAAVAERARLPTLAPSGLAVGEDAAWATSSTDGTLWRIGPDGTVGAVEVGSGATDVTSGGGSTWVANPLAGTLTQVDARAMRVTRIVRVPGLPRSVALDGGTLWATVGGDDPATTTRVSGLRALPPSACEPLVAGGAGKADVLLVSDLPLQGGVRITATQMVQAITFVLREHDFRAGRLRVGYQSCDDSVARTGLFDEAKCASNARAYGRNPDVVAVIGTLNSPCAVAAVPELNRAPGGPLAMVSPLNSFVGLTREAPGVPPTLLGELYPTGKRNYLRVYPTDDLQGAALATFARDRERRRVFVLDDGEPGYGRLMADGFAIAARRLGLDVVGRARWDPSARRYPGLARRVAAAGPEAVFVGGLLDTNAARVIRDVRAAAPAADLLGPDGLTPLPLLERSAGKAARGVFVSLAGVVPEALPPAGAAFVRRFARTQPGAEIEPSAVYAAQAAEVVLDALARSDATRRSVLDALFATRIEDGLLGDFAFDERGDITESPVTILRLARGGSSRRVQSVEGGVVERVSRPAAALVAPGE